MKPKPFNLLSYIRNDQLRGLLYPALMLAVILFLISRTPFLHYAAIQTIPETTRLTSQLAKRSPYVSVTVSKLYYSGDDYWVNGVLTGHFYYTLTDGRCRYYVVKARAGQPAEKQLTGYSLVGRVDELGTQLETLSEHMAEAVQWTKRGVRGLTDRWFVNETAYLTWKECLLIAILILSGILCLLMLARMLFYLLFPRMSRAYRRLGRYGNAAWLAADMEGQLAQKLLIHSRSMYLTLEYLVELAGDLTAVIPLESILWIYDHAALHYGIRGRRLSYTLHVVTMQGDEYHLKRKTAEDVQIIYRELTNRFPNYFYGYSREHERMVRHLIRESKKEKKK